MKKKIRPIAASFIIRELLENNFLVSELEDNELIYLADLSPKQLMYFRVGYLQALSLFWLLYSEKSSRNLK
jgi:hypothetical protein